MLLALAAAAAIMAPLAVSATARAAPIGPRGSAFAWANKPATASYMPSPDYQWNSHHRFTPVNTINHTGKGSYTVRLPDLGAKSGTAIATAYGSNPNYCKVADLRPSRSPSRPAELVDVRCFTVKGAPADTRFTMSYTNLARPGYDLAYVLANQPNTGSYAPSLHYQANSTGATNQIKRLGTGKYLVKLPKLGNAGGQVQVTAEGDGTARCKVGGWGPHGTEQDIGVFCHTPGGNPVNSKFMLTYVRNGNILGQLVGFHPDGHPTAYAWANLPRAASYTPDSLRQFTDSGQPITINRLAKGSYAVYVPGGVSSGNVQVTAYGSGPTHCKVNFWTPAAGIRVLCFGADGSHVDTRFAVSFVGPFIIG